MSGPSRRKPVATEPPASGGWRGLFVGRQAGWGAIGVLLAAVAVGFFIWWRFSPDVRSDPDYLLRPEAIELRGRAPWVTSDIKTEALRNASLDGGVPLDDAELPRRLARAFDMHPWVRQVVRVEPRHPAGAIVEIQCREPVAMVGVKGGLLAIDDEGVVLPSGDFTAESAARYPRIVGVDSSPQGPEGSAWGDPIVEEAAALAVAIGPEWHDVALVECRPEIVQGRRMWKLLRDNGGTILFGAAPGREAAGEPLAAGKVARLRSLARRGAGAADEIDLTKPDPSESGQPAAISQ